MRYGIGRLPRDVDETAESLARLEAETLAPRRGKLPRRKCLVCGAPADMSASLGPACPDHYDELS